MCKFIKIPKLPKWKLIFVIGNVFLLAFELLFLLIASNYFAQLEKFKLVFSTKHLHFITDIDLPGQIFIITLLPLIGFFGVCGIFSECVLPIFLYIVLLTSAGVVCIIAGIKGLAQENYVINQIISEITTSFAKRNTSQFLDYQWSEMEKLFYCCGVNGPENYENHRERCGSQAIPEKSKIGCGDAVYSWTSELLTRVGISGIILGTVMMCFVFWAMFYTTKHFFCKSFSCRSSASSSIASGSS